MKMPRVLIVGAGFGGLYAAREFRDTLTEVTVVERRGSWMQVRVANGTAGWVASGAIETITQ